MATFEASVSQFLPKVRGGLSFAVMILRNADFCVFTKYEDEDVIRNGSSVIISAATARKLRDSLDGHIKWAEENPSEVIIARAREAYQENLKFAIGKNSVGCVYLGRREDGAIKIGFSRTPEIRVASLKLEMISWHDGTMAHEQALHCIFMDSRLNGEYFKMSDFDVDLAELLLEEFA